MKNMIELAKQQVKETVMNALGRLVAEGKIEAVPLPAFNVERPADVSHGDFSCNAAMASAKALKNNPRAIGQMIADAAILDGTVFEKIEVAGPGFLNFFISPIWFNETVGEVISSGSDYGKTELGKGKRVLVEFVSANPTGPMHIGNARGGALGDSLSSVLQFAGYDVEREFYVNDAGNQIEKFGCSLEARYLQIFKGDEIEFPEDGYQGEDIKDLAKEYADLNGDSLVNVSAEERKKALVDYALPKNIEKMQADMEKYKIFYDKWFFESELHKSGAVKAVVDLLTEKGLTYEKEGAVWYKNKEVLTQKLLKEGKSQKYIDNLELKDDVLIRQNGNPTYFTADIAYHKNKFDRGFTTLIDVWGADHHGHVMRMKGAMDAIGYDGDKLNVVLMQLVKLVKDGELVKMSKRTGKAIQLGDLLDEVPVDSARFLFNTKEANTQMDFDLDLAVSQDNQNPVYYVQYAHARICSIFKSLAKEGISPRECTDAELALLTAPEEKELINHLASYTNEIISAAKDYDPTKVTRYVTQLATLFHKFYNACRVKGEEEGLMQARLALCNCVRAVIKNVLTMFNISCPESM